MNQTIEKQLNRRSIRAFKQEPIPNEDINVLIDVARSSASANFAQQVSLISITDTDMKEEIARICKQEYVAESAHLFILVLDAYRNASIAKEEGADIEVSSSTDRFLSSVMDASLMAQNIAVAADSMNYGSVFLGSIMNDAQRIIELLDLPELTFPLLGLAIGIPDQDPQIKPKLPSEFMHFENKYTRFENYHETLKDYGEVVTTYYDLRNSNKRIDSFTTQMTRRMSEIHPNRMKILEVLHKQGFIKY